MVFCNMDNMTVNTRFATVTILILIDGFLQLNDKIDNIDVKMSQSLLIDGFLQFIYRVDRC